MIGSFASGVTASLVTKNGTKNCISHFKTDFDVRDVNNCIKMSEMIRSFASGVTASLVAKNGTKNLSQPFEDRF